MNMEHRWNETDRAKQNNVEKKLSQVLFYPQKILTLTEEWKE